jgi:hypothetical protein
VDLRRDEARHPRLLWHSVDGHKGAQTSVCPSQSPSRRGQFDLVLSHSSKGRCSQGGGPQDCRKVVRACSQPQEKESETEREILIGTVFNMNPDFDGLNSSTLKTKHLLPTPAPHTCSPHRIPPAGRSCGLGSGRGDMKGSWYLLHVTIQVQRGPHGPQPFSSSTCMCVCVRV